MHLSATAVVVGVSLSVVSLLANRENQKHQISNGTYKMQKTLSYVLVAAAVCAYVLAFYWLIGNEQSYQGKEQDALVPAVIGLFATLCALTFSLYEVRIEKEYFRFGLRGRQSMSYSDVVEIHDIRNQGSPRMVLVTKSGRKIGIWSNLLGYDQLVEELKRRCVCHYELVI